MLSRLSSTAASAARVARVGRLAAEPRYAAALRAQALLRVQAAQRASCRPFSAVTGVDVASPLGEGQRGSRPSRGPGRGAQVIKASALLIGGAGIAYLAIADVRNAVDDAAVDVVEFLEDFNDSSREFFERIGDRFVPRRAEPWLLELATMKYPENIPTLVMDLDKVILLLEHDSRQGWHVIKRPFADQFFKEISHYYEVVLFSDDVFPVALDIASKWNLPVTGVLHRDFCKKKRSHYVKDLSKLGRRLDRVLMIDHDPAAFSMQPGNGILIKPFTGDTSDMELADLLDFLKAAATTTSDIREFVTKFGGGDEDIGRRYLLHKQDQEQLVAKRRSVGRYFSAGASRSGFRGAGAPSSVGASSSFAR